ncbi:MAG TPA: response regulator [Terriglobales bacterium]|jgi:DNA-binding response OmpR family regulator|nr:response regulator [Terriglobales bacterium]
MTDSRPKILSIDDNQSLNSMRQMVLAVSGFDCDLASTAEQALAMILTCHYDAILLDYYLPGTTGSQVANTIKTLRPEVPIIVVTGEELDEHSDAVHSYMVKGEGPEVLLAKLHSVVNAKSINSRTMQAAAS